MDAWLGRGGRGTRLGTDSERCSGRSGPTSKSTKSRVFRWLKGSTAMTAETMHCVGEQRSFLMYIVAVSILVNGIPTEWIY